MEWLKGIIAMLLALGTLYILITVGINYGGLSAVVSVFCMIFSILGVLSLIYAIEEDSFTKGCLVPVLFTLAGLIGYFGGPPLEETIFLCVLGSIFALIVVSVEGG